MQTAQPRAPMGQLWFSIQSWLFPMLIDHNPRRGEKIGFSPAEVRRYNARTAVEQTKVDEKSNEITAIPVLLRALELSGCIVTIDAMGCQKKIAREIVDADADYALALKGNQETVHDEVKSYMDDIEETTACIQARHRQPLCIKRPGPRTITGLQPRRHAIPRHDTAV